MKIKLSLLILICTYLSSTAQSSINLGEGSIKIGMYAFNAKDTANVNTDPENLFLYFNYHIRKDKILRDTDVNANLDHTSLKRSDLNNATIVNSLSVKVNIPTYIIDWKEKKTYTVYKKKDSTFVFKNDLKQEKQELFFKMLANPQKNDVIVDTTNQILVYICDVPCYQAKYATASGWRKFAYTKQRLSFFSPLNALFIGFPFSVLSVDAENTDDQKNRARVTGISRFQVMDFNEKKPDKSLFKLPKKYIIVGPLNMYKIYG